MFEIQIGVHAINSAATFNMSYIRCARVEQACQRILNYCLTTWNQGLECGKMQTSEIYLRLKLQIFYNEWTNYLLMFYYYMLQWFAQTFSRFDAYP